MESFPVQILIFTDLDGTLLDHDDYGYAGAESVLKRIVAQNIPLVITTSKTRREVEPLMVELGLRFPFIVENGGGIFFPEPFPHENDGALEKKDGYDALYLGAQYRDVRTFFMKTASLYAIRGFGDMTVAEIAEITGLSMGNAERAREREFSEPFVAENGHDIEKIEEMAGAEGFKVTKGGRFFHLLSAGQDKGVAVGKVIDIYRKKHDCGQLVTIGAGDSENDLPMLMQVDIPVLMPRPRKGWLNIELPGIVRAREPGSRGWGQAVGGILDRFREGSHDVSGCRKSL